MWSEIQMSYSTPLNHQWRHRRRKERIPLLNCILGTKETSEMDINLGLTVFQFLLTSRIRDVLITREKQELWQMTEDHRVVQSHRAADSSALKSPSSWHHLALCRVSRVNVSKWWGIYRSLTLTLNKTLRRPPMKEAHKGQELQNIVCVERWMWKRCQWDVASRHVGLHFEEGKSSKDLSSWQQTHSHQQPDLKIKNKLTKQWEQEHNHRHGDHAEGYQWGREEENWGEGTGTKKQKG